MANVNPFIFQKGNGGRVQRGLQGSWFLATSRPSTGASKATHVGPGEPGGRAGVQHPLRRRGKNWRKGKERLAERKARRGWAGWSSRESGKEQLAALRPPQMSALEPGWCCHESLQSLSSRGGMTQASLWPSWKVSRTDTGGQAHPLPVQRVHGMAAGWGLPV